jgi:hypothetical protein
LLLLLMLKSLPLSLLSLLLLLLLRLLLFEFETCRNEIFYVTHCNHIQLLKFYFMRSHFLYIFEKLILIPSASLYFAILLAI